MCCSARTERKQHFADVAKKAESLAHSKETKMRVVVVLKKKIVSLTPLFPFNSDFNPIHVILLQDETGISFHESMISVRELSIRLLFSPGFVAVG